MAGKWTVRLKNPGWTLRNPAGVAYGQITRKLLADDVADRLNKSDEIEAVLRICSHELPYHRFYEDGLTKNSDVFDLMARIDAVLGKAEGG